MNNWAEDMDEDDYYSPDHPLIVQLARLEEEKIADLASLCALFTDPKALAHAIYEQGWRKTHG